MKAIPIISLLAIMAYSFVSITNCKARFDLNQDPLKGAEAYFVRHSIDELNQESSIELFINLDAALNESLQVDSVYFRYMSAPLQQINGKDKEFVAYFNLFRDMPDISISSDPKDEFRNRLPIKAVPMPIRVKTDECVLAYTLDGERKYAVIKNLRQR